MYINEKTARILETITTEQWAAIADFAKGQTNLQEGEPVPERKRLTDDELYLKVSNILKEIGIPVNIKGYPYLREAVVLVYKRQSYINAVTKELYPDIAKKFKTTGSRVERAIRHAIECGLERGDYNVILKYFASIPANANLTNSQFVASIADYLSEGNINV